MVIRRRANPGFALVDVIVAVVILGVGLAVIISLSGRSIASAQQGETLAIAAALADEQLNLVLARGPDDYARRFPVEGACDVPFESYDFRLEFSGGRSVGEPYDVRVTISWGGGSGGGSSGSPAASSSSPAAVGASASDSKSLTIRTLMAVRDLGIEAETDPDRRPVTPIQRGAL